MKIKRVKVEMYSFEIILILGTKSEIESRLKKERPKFSMGRGLTKAIKGRCGYEIYINVESKKSVLAIFTHELIHVVDRTSAAIGAEDERELRAYLAGFLWQKFESMLLEAETQRKIKEKEG